MPYRICDLSIRCNVCLRTGSVVFFANDIAASAVSFSKVQLHQWLEEAGFGKLEVPVVSRETESSRFQTVLQP